MMEALLSNPIDPVDFLADYLEKEGKENEIAAESNAKVMFEELLTHVDEMSARLADEKGENSTMATGVTGYSWFSKR